MANLKTNAGRPKLFSIDVEVEQSPEEKLWKAVLYQGVFEALSFRHNAIPLTDQEKKTTRNWINLNNTDFKEVCENAGYDPIFIINKIKKVLTSKQLDNSIEINPVVANSIVSEYVGATPFSKPSH